MDEEEPITGTSPDQYLHGRGAQFDPPNRFLKQEKSREHLESIDDWIQPLPATTYLEENARGLVNKVESPDVGMWYSMNPYQGCEHGCIYCYARNSHEYWGYSAGLDFERKIIVKKNAPLLLRKFLLQPKWVCVPLSLSGNTDCYQPAEKKFRITRQLLEICLEFRQPVGIITKNAGILRDRDLLEELARRDLVCVMVSTTSFNEELRRVMEPRTTTAQQRIRVMRELSAIGVPVGVMAAPMIPGLNDHEMSHILRTAAAGGATFSGYTLVRLNGAVKLIFRDWLFRNFPDRAEKVWHLIESCHGGKVNDNEFGKRMRGSGSFADLIHSQYQLYAKKYGLTEAFHLNTKSFCRPGQQGSLF